MRRLLGPVLAAAVSVLAGSAFAAGEVPTPGVLDPRIRTVLYDPDQVVQLRGWFGYQMMIEFEPGERIENVSIGDAMGWQVTPNKRANLLFLKPVDRSAVTNMTVVTDRRRYAFDLTVATEKARPESMAYVVRFRYPQAAPVQIELPEPVMPEAPPPPRPINSAYTYSGAQETLPSKVYDDGVSTYFSWPATAPVPAVFAVNADGAESLVNYAVRGEYLVVDQLAPRFVLRNGASVTTVVNTAFALPQPGAGSPTPAKIAKAAR